MKQIPLLQGKALLIELSKQDFIKAKIQTLVDLHTVWSGKLNFKNGDRWESVSLPPGNWRIIGMLSEVTEEDAAEIVGPNGNGDYRNYVGAWGGFATAIQSLDSAIEAEGYLLKSPPAPKCGCTGPAEEGVCDACDEWMTAQSHVLDRSRCLLLGRAEK